MMVRKGGLEPPCLSAPPPQDGVSANFTTSALATERTHNGLASRTQRHFKYNKRPDSFRSQYFTISVKPLGSRLAPPTSAPSISSSHIRALQLLSLTLPPYRMRKFSANSSPKAFAAS